MPTRVWTHLCDYASVDAAGKPMIIGEFEFINTRGDPPVRHGFIFVASKWNGHSNEEFSHQVRILDTRGEVLAESPVEQARIKESPKGEGNHVTISAFVGLVFPEIGDYAVEILINDTPVDVQNLELRKVD